MTSNSNDGTPILPIPQNADKSTIKISGIKPKLYPYRNAQGKILFYIAVAYDGESKKSVFPVYWEQDQMDQGQWVYKQLLEQNRPLLNLPSIINNFDKSIIVGEGEKTAEALSKLFPDFTATTSCGGANAAKKTNWSVLKGRDVILSLDYDKSGKEYGFDVYELCKQAGAKSIKLLPTEIFNQYAIKDNQVIKQERDLPPGYDLADALGEGWTAEHIRKLEKILQQEGDSLFVDVLESIAESIISFAENEYEWSAPQPIKNDLLPVEQLPLEIIPESLQAWLQDIAYRMQCPPEHVSITAMVALGSLIGVRCGIRPKTNDNWLIVPNLWGGVVGNPSTLKSPAMTEALKPLAQLETQARKRFDKEREEYAYNLKALKISEEAQTSRIKNDIKTSKDSVYNLENITQQLKGLEKLKEPTCHRFKTNDATVEKMTELLQENPQGLLLYRDELIGLLTNWDKAGHESDRAFYLEAWNGLGSHTTDRIGRGTTHCDNVCVSILGGTQPNKILNYLHRAINNIENDGLIQRFQLLVYPDELEIWELIDNQPNKEAQLHAFQIFEAIAAMNFVHHGAIHEEGSIPYFHFSLEAQKLFYDWLTDLEKIKLRGQEHSIITEHLAKYRKLMPALALIIHVVDIAAGKATGFVSLQAAEKAAAWCDFLESHARRLYGLVTNIAPEVAKVLKEKLEEGELKEGFTIRDIYRKGWHLLNTKENAQLACDVLVKFGWLRKRLIEPTQKQKSTIQYLINPKIGE